MVKILCFIIFILVTWLLFLGLRGLIRKLAYDQSERYLHCRLIIAVFLVLLAATNVYTVSYLLQGIDALINSPKLAPFFNVILPNRAYELIYMLLMLMCLNLAVAILVCIAVLVTKLIFARYRQFVDIYEYVGFFRLLHLPWMFTALVYDNQNGRALLNGRGFTACRWVRGIKKVFGILLSAELLTVAVSILWGRESWNETLLEMVKAWYLLPMASYLLIEQLQLFLEGNFDDEAGSFGTAEISEIQDGGMNELMEAYRETFAASDALLYSGVGTGATQEESGLGSNDFGNRQIQDCDQPEVLHVLENQLRHSDAKQNVQYQNALVALLNGKSINICDHSEGDFLLYLTAYLNFYMAQGKTALVLCKDREQADRMCSAMDNRMQKLNELYSIWNISTLEGAELNNRMNILVCSYDDFLQYNICQKRQDFVSDLFCTVIADGKSLFSRANLGVERLFGLLRSLEIENQYVLFTDVDNDTLRTAMEQVVKCEIHPYGNNDVHYPNAGMMVWREESFCRLQHHIGVGNALSPYMGTALPLALLATKYDMPQMYIMCDCARGDRSYSDVLAMCGREVANYLEKDINLQSVIRYQLDEALKAQDLSMLIAYDSDYNFFNALWRWIRYGGQRASLLHIVSPPYALREYFAANLDNQKLLLKNNEFDALISYQLGMKISHMAVLLVCLCDKGMTDVELMEKSKEFHWNYENVEQLLTDCLRLVLTREELHNIYECFHFEEEKIFHADRGVFETRTRITLTDVTIRKRLDEQIGFVDLVTGTDRHQQLPILRGNVQNFYQRGQILAAGGYLYQIRSISDGNIYAEQTLPRNIPQYFPIVEFDFQDYQQTDNCVDSGFMDLNICTAKVTQRIYGYWSSNRGNCVSANCDLQVNDLRDAGGNAQQTTINCANILEINIRRSALGDKATETIRLLAYLLKDMAKTLFPATHPNLYAVLAEGYDPARLQQVLSLGGASDGDDLICSLVPGLTRMPRQDPDFITVYVVEASCIEYGMVQMLYSKFRSVLLMIREYLHWYIDDAPADADGNIQPSSFRGSYLHFGADNVPAVIDPAGLLDLCSKLLPERQEPVPVATVEKKNSGNLCTFCHRPTMFYTGLGDNRRMCAHCKDHQLTQQDEIKTMFVNTVNFLKDGYQISLPDNIHVRFQSADAIRKATHCEADARILGFYSPGNHQLWLEGRGPRIAMQSTLVHELTHVWQYDDPEFSKTLPRMLRKFPKKKRDLLRLLLLEGHAVFMEIDAMRKLNEQKYADRTRMITMLRNDEYGKGYRLVAPYITDCQAEGSYVTPFVAMRRLVQDIIDGKVTINEELL